MPKYDWLEVGLWLFFITIMVNINLSSFITIYKFFSGGE